MKSIVKIQLPVRANDFTSMHKSSYSEPSSLLEIELFCQIEMVFTSLLSSIDWSHVAVAIKLLLTTTTTTTKNPGQTNVIQGG